MFVYTKPKVIKIVKGLAWEDILKIAEKYTSRAKKEFLEAIAETQDSIVLSELAEAIERGDLARAMDKIDWGKLTLFAQTFKDTFAEIIREAGEYAAKNLKKLGIEMKFDLLNPKVIDYINDHTGELIRQIADEQRKIVQDIIRRAFEEGGHPRKTAKQIREVIGLTERQANAVNRLRQSMLEQGISVSKVEEAVSKYADRLRKYRAETIARTETMTAVNKGQRLAWEQAVDNGYLDPAKYEREWVVTPDDLLCEQCAEMQGARAPIGGVYPNGVEGPPLHPRCFSEDTEVFTEEGWKFFYELKGHERIWTLNMETEELELDEVNRWIDYHYEGEMIHLKTHTIDCLVTPNHDMVVRSNWMHKHHRNSPLILKQITKLGDSDVIPRTAKWKGKDVDYITIGDRKFPAKEFMRFLGWYIAEGNISKPPRGHWQIKISQEKPEYREEIISLSKKLFGEIWIGKNAIYIPHVDDIREYFLSIGKANEKHIPKELKSLAPDLLWEFLEAFILGDGYIKQGKWQNHPEWNFGKEYIATTSSTQLMNDLTELALKVGKRPSFSLALPKTIKHRNGFYTSKYPQWHIRFGNRKYSYYHHKYVQKVPYNGQVYCVEMKKNPVIFVRRNGKTLWAGNCRCTEILVRRE